MSACDAPWHVWQEFSQRWQNALAKHGAPYLHMREFAHFTGKFKGWSEARRRAMMADCLDALNDLEILMLCVVMRSSDFARLPPAERAGLVDPYLCCFQECLFGTSLTGYLTFYGDSVDIVYSRQDEFRTVFR